MHVGKDYYVEMSRPEAIQHLSIRPSSPTNTKILPKSTTATMEEESKRTTIRPSTTTKDDNDDNNNTISNNINQGNTDEQINETKSAAPMGFFEIREEYDSQGREIKAEAIDVAKELKYLQKQSKNEGNADNLLEGYSSKNKGISSSSWELEEEFHEEVEEKKTRANVSDEDYAALSSRLEELALLEEQAKKQKKTNIKSSKKLQSKSWGKGFLDGPKKSKNNHNIEGGKNSIKKSSNDGGWGTGFLNNPKKSEKSIKKVSQVQRTVTDSSRSEAQSRNSANIMSESAKKVVFQQNDEIREIPRIGQRSAADLRPQVPQKQSPINPPVQSRSLEKNIFTGLVKERPVATNRIGGLRSETAPAPRKKKLSKFAQERQTQGR
mmetsp:Transcript_13040/g.18463  ORF Transcript_13040/g.18463 Transcript_13040/m.18463 type:complete len:380 (+) Transcript_13040:94-1233(+)